MLVMANASLYHDDNSQADRPEQMCSEAGVQGCREYASGT
jgi:hypothetical protein